MVLWDMVQNHELGRQNGDIISTFACDYTGGRNIPIGFLDFCSLIQLSRFATAMFSFCGKLWKYCCIHPLLALHFHEPIYQGLILIPTHPTLQDPATTQVITFFQEQETISLHRHFPDREIVILAFPNNSGEVSHTWKALRILSWWAWKV